MDIATCFINLCIFSVLILLIGFLTSAVQFKGSNFNLSTLLTKGSVLFVVIISTSITNFITIYSGVTIFLLTYFFFERKNIAFLALKVSKFKEVCKHLIPFGIFLLLSFLSILLLIKSPEFSLKNTPSFYDLYCYHGVATNIIEQSAENRYFFWNHLNSIGPSTYHYFDIWLDVFCIKMFGNSSFNNYQLIVIPFLQALLFQSIYDYLAPAIQKYLNKYYGLIAISILFFAISPSSLFNDFPYLEFIPTQRSYVLFSPTNFKLLIIYILLIQSLIELENNSKKIPISLFLLPLIYLTTLPLLLVSFSLFTCWLLQKREYLNAIKNVIYIFTICVICISLLKWNFNEDSSLLIENVFNKNISLILAIKYFVVSLIQIIALSWLLIFLIFIIIFRIGVQKFKDKYHFWLFIFVPPLILGALIFPYAKEFGFDNDQYLYNLIIPLISASIVYFIKEVLIFKSITQTPKTLFLLVLVLFYSVFLNTSRALNSWKYYRPSFYENISNEFVLEIGDTFNTSEKKWKGISISYKDTLHWSYSSGHETWQLGDGWISSYLKNSIAPSNFSRFYFQDNGKNLMLKKKYVIQLLKKNNIKDINKYSNKDLIEIFIKKSDLDYLICDFDIERSFTNCFKDSIRDKKSKSKIYFNNIHTSDFMKPATK